MSSSTRSQAGRKRAARRLTEGPCHWCGVWTDPGHPVGHPRKATWDHLVPQSHEPSQGYRHLELMVRACSTCNSARGNRGTPVAPAATNASRSW